MPSNCTTRCNSLAMAWKRSLGSRCEPIACDTRINASYRSDGRYSNGAPEREIMRLGVATILPLFPLDARLPCGDATNDIVFQAALLEPSRATANRHRRVAVRGPAASRLDNADAGSSAMR